MQIAGRDLLGSGVLPLAQLAVAGTLGLSAAGAFQIATRILGLIDALTLAPLRFTALPRLRSVSPTTLAPALAGQLRLTATVSAWVWGGTLAALPEIARFAAGDQHGAAVAPVVAALAGFGLSGAMTMPVNQAVLAQGGTRLMLDRALAVCGLSALLLPFGLAVGVTGAAVALSLAALLASLWHLSRALPILGLSRGDLAPVVPPLGAGSAMTLALIPLAGLPFMAKVVIGTTIYAALLALCRPAPRVPA